MFKLADRVKETSTTTGNGSLTLAGAVTGFQTFLAGVGEGNQTYYAIAHQTLTEWEVGVGVYSSGMLSRDTVLSSSTGSKINFSAGSKEVFVTLPAAFTGPNTVVDGGLPDSSFASIAPVDGGTP